MTKIAPMLAPDLRPAVGGLSDDAIAGTMRVWQRRRGHRYSLDDVATAWEAAKTMPDALNHLDLGSGIGSVLLMVAHKLPHARHSAVEAQEISYSLLERNVARNDLEDRVGLVFGDLRDAGIQAKLEGPFDLITGTPPYMPVGTATPSPDSQRAHARVELRGGIEDYLWTASKLLAPKGRFVVCADARKPERALDGGEAAGLKAIRKRDVIPREGRKDALFTVWTFAHDSEPQAFEKAEPLIARDTHGGRTQAVHAIRRFFDLPVNDSEPASPGKR